MPRSSCHPRCFQRPESPGRCPVLDAQGQDGENHHPLRLTAIVAKVRACRQEVPVLLVRSLQESNEILLYPPAFHHSAGFWRQ